MASSIGIKLADGSFFPILDEEPSSEKNLELTTMRDNQESVQINLFKKDDIIDPEYIGSLIVEDISKGIAGDPTINLKIKLDEDQNLSAEALDIASGMKQSLKVSLKKLSADDFDVPDFGLSDNDLGIGDDPNRDDVFVSESNDSNFDIDEEIKNDFDEEEEDDHRRHFPLWAIILLVLFCIAALVIAILLLLKPAPESDSAKAALTKTEKTNSSSTINSTTTKVPKEDPKEKANSEAKKKAELEAKQKVEEEARAKEKAELEAKQKAEEEARKKEKAELEAKQKAEEEARAKEQAAEETKRKAKEEAERKIATKNKAPKIDSRGVVKYRLKWGDTLWDLSESFYKTPWDYEKIAEYNKIRNPSVIIAGTYIEIPPK